VSATRRAHPIVALWVALTLVGCEREMRVFQPPATGTSVDNGLRLTELQPGAPQPSKPPPSPYEENAHAIAQGKRWFRWYNCNGCHANGGGDSGPALIDDTWLYGHEPDQVFATIAQGRPNGMPSFRGHVSDQQIWQLVAYVRSMSGLVRADAAPGRSDTLSPAIEPEQRREAPVPKDAGVPPTSTQ
jgi:cytochrome c oxidase cbb3-type subunit 3